MVDDSPTQAAFCQRPAEKAGHAANPPITRPPGFDELVTNLIVGLNRYRFRPVALAQR